MKSCFRSNTDTVHLHQPSVIANFRLPDEDALGEVMSAVNLSRAGIIIRNSQWSSFYTFCFVPRAISYADPFEMNVHMEIKQQSE